MGNSQQSEPRDFTIPEYPEHLKTGVRVTRAKSAPDYDAPELGKSQKGFMKSRSFNRRTSATNPENILSSNNFKAEKKVASKTDEKRRTSDSAEDTPVSIIPDVKRGPEEIIIIPPGSSLKPKSVGPGASNGGVNDDIDIDIDIENGGGEKEPETPPPSYSKPTPGQAPFKMVEPSAPGASEPRETPGAAPMKEIRPSAPGILPELSAAAPGMATNAFGEGEGEPGHGLHEGGEAPDILHADDLSPEAKQIIEFKKLHDAGVITSEEFSEFKSKLLSRI